MAKNTRVRVDIPADKVEGLMRAATDNGLPIGEFLLYATQGYLADRSAAPKPDPPWQARINALEAQMAGARAGIRTLAQHLGLPVPCRTCGDNLAAHTRPNGRCAVPGCRCRKYLL